MKSSLLLLAVLTGSAIAETQMTDRITPEQMAERQAAASPFAELQKQQTAGEKEAKVTRPGDQSIIKQSEILHDGQNWTMVPKGAVLHVPAQMRPRVGTKPLGTLLVWNDFLTANRAWIKTEEITFDQAAGKQALDPAKVEYWKNQTSVVIAVHQGGPISVKTVNNTTPAVTANQ